MAAVTAVPPVPLSLGLRAVGGPSTFASALPLAAGGPEGSVSTETAGPEGKGGVRWGCGAGGRDQR